MLLFDLGASYAQEHIPAEAETKIQEEYEDIVMNQQDNDFAEGCHQEKEYRFSFLSESQKKNVGEKQK
jgi:hypothetical protein